MSQNKNNSKETNENPIPEIGFLRIYQIIGDKKQGIPAIIPVGRTSWLAGVEAGIYPQPVRLGIRMWAWRVEDIRDLISRLSNGMELSVSP